MSESSSQADEILVFNCESASSFEGNPDSILRRGTNESYEKVLTDVVPFSARSRPTDKRG